jgi:hypothetical protein
MNGDMRNGHPHTPQIEIVPNKSAATQNTEIEQSALLHTPTLPSTLLLYRHSTLCHGAVNVV